MGVVFQGPTRLHRALHFTAAREFASEQGVPFNWRLESVSGVSHSNRQVSPAAADVLLAPKFPSPARHSIRVLRCGDITLHIFGQKQPSPVQFVCSFLYLPHIVRRRRIALREARTFVAQFLTLSFGSREW